MQRLLSLKLLSNIPRNPSSRTLISKTNQCYPSPQQLFPAPYTTFSHSWRPQSPGFFSKQLLANTRFRGDLVNHIVGLVRTRSGRRNFHSNFLVGSTRRSWYCTIPFYHHYLFSSPGTHFIPILNKLC